MTPRGRVLVGLEEVESSVIAIDAVNRCMISLTAESDEPGMFVLNGLMYANKIIVQQATDALGNIYRNINQGLTV